MIFVCAFFWKLSTRSVGFLSVTVPVYQCEISPGHARGKFLCIEYLFLNCGYLASAWIGYAFFFDIPSEVSWFGALVLVYIIRSTELTLLKARSLRCASC